ncbi:MAG: hypothetical protein SF052_02715 [Bacteroidia bacterium]|nr:hypothetical protein [Bacteroidia bacterium]
MYKIPAIFIFSFLFAFSGCKKSPKENGTPTTGTDNPQTTENPTTTIAPKEKITGILLAYYNDLSNEELDEARYFAPTLKKFFGSENISRDQVAKSIRTGFQTVESRSIHLNNKSLQVIPAGEGFIAEFSGVSSYIPTGKTERVEQLFSNRVSFDKDFQITGYETIDNPSSATLSREGLTGGKMEAARAILTAIRTGDTQKAAAYIHPQKGFYFLTQPGAMSVPYLCKSLPDIFTYAPWLEKGTPALNPQPIEESLPDFDCGELFSKQGCFMANFSGYKDISSLMGTLKELEMGDYGEKQIATAQNLESFVSVRIIDTDANMGFLLGEIEGRWYLLVMDIATYECSA